MGNVCNAFRSAIDYVLRYILPTCTSYLPGRYIGLINESFTSLEDADREGDRSLPNGQDLVSLRSQNYNRRSSQRTDGNAHLLKEIISNFFRNYNFQIRVLGGNVVERNLANVEDALQSSKTERSWKYINADLGLEQPKRTFRQEDLIPGFQHMKINEVDNNSRKARIEFLNRYNQTRQYITEEHVGGAQTPASERTRIESHESNLKNQRRRYGTAPTRGISKNRSRTVKFSRSQSLVDEPTDRIHGDSSVTEYNLRKISLPDLYSGSHVLLDEDNENIKLNNYSSETVPLRIHVPTHRQMSHQSLGSGGLMAYEELSSHLETPNYYAADPIVYDELPQGVVFPKSSPMKMQSQQAVEQPSSCSGGGVVPDFSRRVSLPDIYPQRNSRLHLNPSLENAQSSLSFGRLVTPEKDQDKTLQDLIRQSYQRSISLSVAERNDLNKLRQNYLQD